MSDATTTAVAEATAAPKAAKPKKPTPAKKPAAKAAPNANGRAPKAGLRKPQLTILAYLNKQKGPKTRAQIKAATNVGISEALGRYDPTTRGALEKALGYPSLLTLKHVRELTLDIDGTTERGYEITAAGKKALARE